MKTVMLTISKGSLIRNFFHSGVIGRLLEHGVRVVVLSPNVHDAELFQPFAHPQLCIEPLIGAKQRRWKKFFEEISKAVIFNKTVHVRYRYRFAGPKPNKLWYLPRMLFLVPLHWIPGATSAIQWLDRRLNPQPEHDELFKKYQPDVVFITTSGRDHDISVLRSARRFGVPSVLMEKSWDTISKMLFADKADYFFSWGAFMTGQARQYQGYKATDILVTGAPQFDFYAQAAYHETREVFCARHGLDPKKKIILYGSSGGDVCDEVAYLSLLNEWMKAGRLTNVQVLVRPHLGWAGDADRFSECGSFAEFFVDRTDKQNEKFKDHWDTSIDHVVNLTNSLRHAAVCVNIGSTLTLDAVASETPVININFDVDPAVDSNLSTKRLYMTDYIEAISQFGATWLVRSQEEFLQALIATVEHNERREEENKKMVKRFMYANDGKSANRIVQVLLDIVEHKRVTETIT